MSEQDNVKGETPKTARSRRFRQLIFNRNREMRIGKWKRDKKRPGGSAQGAGPVWRVKAQFMFYAPTAL